MKAGRKVLSTIQLGDKNHPERPLNRAAQQLGFVDLVFAIEQCGSDRIRTIETLLSTVDHFGRQSRTDMKIRFGFGHSLSLSIAPKIIRDFRRLESFAAVEIECVVDDGEKLVESLKAHRLDVVLTALRSGIDTPKPEHQIPLWPALIAGTRHGVARRYREAGGHVSLTDIIRQTKKPDDEKHVIHILGNNTAFDKPMELLGDLKNGFDIRYFHQANYAAINELVAVGDDLGITIPNFLTEHQAARVQVMPIVVPPEVPMAHLVLLKETNQFQVDLYESQMRGYQKMIHGFLKIASDQLSSLRNIGAVKTGEEQHSCYIQLYVSGGLQTWFHGSFWMFSRHGSSFSGDLHLTQIWLDNQWQQLEPPQLYSISGKDEDIGNACKFTTIEGRLDIVDEGTGQQIPARSELFVGSIVMNRSPGAMSIGQWLGRESAEPTSGHLLICSGKQECLSATRLNNEILAWDETRRAWATRYLPHPPSQEPI